MRLRIGEKGFTLVEIAVSIAILAIALPPLISAFTRSSIWQAQAENRTMALFLLKYKMAEIESQGFPELGEDEGEFGEDSRFGWQSVVEETEAEGLRKVTVIVHWQERGRERAIGATTYIADRTITSEEQTAGGGSR
jgi:type II secretion system protein I